MSETQKREPKANTSSAAGRNSRRRSKSASADATGVIDLDGPESDILAAKMKVFPVVLDKPAARVAGQITAAKTGGDVAEE